MAPRDYRVKMLEAFEQVRNPTLFYASMFKTTEEDIVDTRKVEIDIQRHGQSIAIDVVPGGIGNMNLIERFTTKEFEPPVYDEYTPFHATTVFDRQFGQPDNVAFDANRFLGRVVAKQKLLYDKELRAMEWQASQALFSGQIPLVNAVTIDFKQKATHQHDAAVAWSDAASKQVNDLQACCELIVNDGGARPAIAVFGKTAWQNIWANTDLMNRLNFRRADVAQLNMPVNVDQGAVYHGTIAAGSYTLDCFTYDKQYDVPTDAELGFPSGTIPNAGTTQPFTPVNSVLVMGADLDLRCVYAATPALVPTVDPALVSMGITAVPSLYRGKYQLYGYPSRNGESVIVGVRSAPLMIPTQIDGWVVLDTAP